MVQFAPAPMDRVKKAAEENAVAGDVFPIGNSLAYVEEDDRPVMLFDGITDEFGWHVSAVDIRHNGGRVVYISPITEVNR